MLSRLGSLLLLLTTACQSTPPQTEPTPEGLCAGLLQAEPQDWPRYVPEILAQESATEPLLAALDEYPEAPGVQAALALLGALGDVSAGPYLETYVRDRQPHAAEAALALGRLPYPSSGDLLRDTARDPGADPTLRAASAAAMVELGRGVEVLDVLRAVLLAGTPAEGPDLGLPSRSRWALERHMILLACQRAGYDLGVDTDSSWPRMREGVETLTRILQEGDR